jgi:hypothetical protein
MALYALCRGRLGKAQAQGASAGASHAMMLGHDAGKAARDAAAHPGAGPPLAGRVTLAPLRDQRADDDQGRAHQCCQARHFSEK